MISIRTKLNIMGVIVVSAVMLVAGKVVIFMFAVCNVLKQSETTNRQNLINSHIHDETGLVTSV